MPEKKTEVIKVTYSEISDAIYHLIKDTTDNVAEETKNTALRSMKLLKGLMEMNGLEELCGSMETGQELYGRRI